MVSASEGSPPDLTPNTLKDMTNQALATKPTAQELNIQTLEDQALYEASGGQLTTQTMQTDMRAWNEAGNTKQRELIAAAIRNPQKEDQQLIAALYKEDSHLVALAPNGRVYRF